VARSHGRPSGSLDGKSEPERGGADPLSDVLRCVRLTGASFFVIDASSPWREALPETSEFGSALLPGARRIISYHVVTTGPCWARLRGGAEARLESGDVLVVPHGHAYALASAPGMPGEYPVEPALEFFEAMRRGDLPFVIEEGGGQPGGVRVICGFLGCDEAAFNPVLSALPPMMVVRKPRGSDRLDALIEFTLAEAEEPRAGGHCVLLRLSELLFVEVVRRHLVAVTAAETGWLAGLRDPTVGQALRLLHRRPDAPWTLESLAREVGVSRSVLAERFPRFVGQPPMRYLAQWRLQLAAHRLTSGDAKVLAIADGAGYESEASFSRAFKRALGVSPSQWRRRRV
jgi:AraC-like DNA-binding protein